MQIRPMAAASALVLTGAIGLSACSGGPRPTGAPASPAITAPIASSSTQQDGSLSSTPAGNGGPAPSQAPAISDTQLSEIDQGLSDANGSLGAADQDVTHNEAGDANP